MATLILEHNGRRKGSVLNGRVVIGRRSNSHIAIPDRSVSRIHAWIGRADGRYFIADTGSRAGTRVNGSPIQGRRLLDDGDQIRIGPAVMIFGANGSLPSGIDPIDLSDRALASDDGIFMDCACGAPLWAPWDFAGRAGQCRYCGQMIALPAGNTRANAPDPSGETMAPGMPAPVARAQIGGVRLTPRRLQAGLPKQPTIFDRPAPAPSPLPATHSGREHEKFCGACQSSISLLEDTTKCPDCGVTFHAECWDENRGCSSYGCKNVGSLDQGHLPEVSGPPSHSEQPRCDNAIDPALAPARAVEWKYLLLLASVVSGLLGILIFGAPSLLTGIVIGVHVRRHRPMLRDKIIAAALVVAAVGMLAGAACSWYWWLMVPAGAVTGT
jgi:hypothetical protein